MKRYCFLLLLPLLYTLTLHAALESTLAQQVDSRENAPTLSLRGSEATKAIHKESAQVDSSTATNANEPQKDSRVFAYNAPALNKPQAAGFLKKHRLTPSGIPCFAMILWVVERKARAHTWRM